MRVTDSLRVNSLQQNIGSSLDSLNTVQQEISSGKKLNLPSDDPAGASQALAWRGALVDNAQYQRDADAANTFLSASDSALSNVDTALMSARQIAVQGANSTQTTTSLQALAAQVDTLIKQVTQIANQDIHGKYLFSGTQTQTPPYKDVDTLPDLPHTYHGDSGAITATLGTGNVQTLNTPGDVIFTPIFSALESLKANLTSGNLTAISANITDVDTALDGVNTVRAQIGGKINEVTATTQRLTRAQGDYQTADSNIEDVDLAQAYVQLQSAQNVYQASLVTTSKAFQYSLADYL